MLDTLKFDKKNTQVVAHRGLSGIETENTATAFVAAGNRSYYGIETDVYRTADGKFMLFHDSELKRIGGEDLLVEKCSLAVYQSVVLFNKSTGKKDRNDIRVATLENYIEICKKYGKVAVLELKSNFTDQEIADMIDIINLYDYLENVTFIAFNIENLFKVRALCPNQTVQFLTKEVSDELIDKLAEAGMDADIHHPSLTKERIDAFHAKGIKLNCWTVDNPERAEELVSWGIDYITTNILE